MGYFGTKDFPCAGECGRNVGVRDTKCMRCKNKSHLQAGDPSPYSIKKPIETQVESYLNSKERGRMKYPRRGKK